MLKLDTSRIVRTNTLRQHNNVLSEVSVAFDYLKKKSKQFFLIQINSSYGYNLRSSRYVKLAKVFNLNTIILTFKL